MTPEEQEQEQQKIIAAIAKKKADLLLISAQATVAELIVKSKFTPDELLENEQIASKIKKSEIDELSLVARAASEKLSEAIKSSLILELANSVIERNKKFITDHPIKKENEKN